MVGDGWELIFAIKYILIFHFFQGADYNEEEGEYLEEQPLDETVMSYEGDGGEGYDDFQEPEQGQEPEPEPKNDLTAVRSPLSTTAPKGAMCSVPVPSSFSLSVHILGAGCGGQLSRVWTATGRGPSWVC